MHVLKSYHSVPDELRGASLAIGNFDGVHRGHRAVLAETLRRAEENDDCLAGVMTFDPHPGLHFRPNAPHFPLSPLPLKLALLEEFGLDLAVVLAFDDALAAVSAGAFIEEILVQGLGVRHVTVGENFRFGNARAGTPQLLVEAGEAHGFGVSIMTGERDEAGVISSSRVRVALSEGRVGDAARLLGYWWPVRGTVVGGAKRGHGLGFPTANITLGQGQDLAHGIYATRVTVDAVQHDSASYLGTRPTFDNGKVVLESFLLDFDGDLYGREIEIQFISHLRPDRAFPDAAALVEQVKIDCEKARAVLARTPDHPV